MWGNFTINKGEGFNNWKLLGFTKLCLFMNDPLECGDLNNSLVPYSDPEPLIIILIQRLK